MKQTFGDKSITGVEIGVQVGYNAMTMFTNLNIKKLYLVDPWEEFPKQYEIAMKRLSPFKSNFVVIKKYSENAVNDIEDNLDFVYVDGNHSYDYVKKDINLYYPKLRKGGIIGGDDFSIDFQGVCKAVLEFVEKNGLTLMGANRDWYFIK